MELREDLYLKDWKSLAHTKLDCKYHMVLISKYMLKEFFDKRCPYDFKTDNLFLKWIIETSVNIKQESLIEK